MKGYKNFYNTFFPARLLYKRIFALASVWVFLILFNYIVKRIFKGILTTDYFPFSVFSPSLEVGGLLYTMMFILILYYLIRYKLYSNIFNTYILGLSLIVLANMSLGNLELAFITPISGGEIQYYHDAIKIDSWKDWLSLFNINQESLLCHSRTHPPGAVLIQKVLFKVSKDPLWISSVFLFFSSFSIILIYKVFIALGKSKIFSNKMALLYAVIPSVNIYSLATLDAIIAVAANILLLTLIVVSNLKQKNSMIFWGLLISISMTLVSLLTFGSLFLWAVLGIFSIYLFLIKKNNKPLILFGTSIILFLTTIILLDHLYSYNYLESFLMSTKIENKQGFMLFSKPINYLMTRIENILEIVVFLSLGVVAFLTTINYKLELDLSKILSLFAISILLLMFLTGAYKTGETARACLFIVGFVLILLKDISNKSLISLISLAAFQTISMQLLGNYFW